MGTKDAKKARQGNERRPEEFPEAVVKNGDVEAGWQLRTALVSGADEVAHSGIGTLHLWPALSERGQSSSLWAERNRPHGRIRHQEHGNGRRRIIRQGCKMIFQHQLGGRGWFSALLAARHHFDPGGTV